MEIGTIKSNGMGPPAPTEIAADAINEILVEKYRKDDGLVDYASVFSALGAFSGFGVQMTIREELVKPGKLAIDKAFVAITTVDGKTYYFGQLLNEGLFGAPGAKISVWSLIAAAAANAGASTLPDIEEIAGHVVETLATKDFGVPRVAAELQPREAPIVTLRQDWRAMRELLVRYYVQPRYWGWTFALGAQRLIDRSRDTFDPAVAAKIAMEVAISMAKVDPRDIRGGD